MALWNKVLQLRPEVMEQIRLSNSSFIPLEVRHNLSDWLETRLLVGPMNLEHEAARFLNDLIIELQRKAMEMSSDEQLSLAKTYLLESASNFQQHFADNPSQLFSHLRNCLMFEKQMLCFPENWNINPDTQIFQIFPNIEDLKSRVRSNEIDNGILKEEFELLNSELYEFNIKNAQYERMTRQAPDQWTQITALIEEDKRRLQACVNQFTRTRLTLIKNFEATIESTENIQQIVIGTYLNNWCVHQRLTDNETKSVIADNFDTIQEWFQNLAEILWNTREQINKAIYLVSTYRKQLIVDQQILPDFPPELLKKCTDLLNHLISRSFIVEKQPPQVIKTNIRFAATIRLLIGNTLNMKMSSPLVQVNIVSELKAQQTHQTNKCSERFSGDILNSSGKMEYDVATKQLSTSFENMILKKIKRTERKGKVCLMDEKFALIFQSNFAIGDLKFSVWALSLPVVVIVHANQEQRSWATIFWDNSFAEINRKPFEVPDKVPWNQLAEALDKHFKSATGRNLTTENLLFLCEKVIKSQVPMSHINDLEISLSQFCKDPLSSHNFTFWEWFYSAMKLIQSDYLRKSWNDESIAGFVHKRRAEEQLLKCSRGTFLLRFSDSELGAISIAWVDEKSNGPHVLHIQPFSAKDLSTRSLSDRIQDLNHLKTLFPNKDKSEAFGKYMTASVKPRQGYVGTKLTASLVDPIDLNCADTSSQRLHFSRESVTISFEMDQMDTNQMDTNQMIVIDNIDFNQISFDFEAHTKKT